MEPVREPDRVAGVDLYWLPLGAGSPVVRRSGQLYERWCAWRQRREPRPLFHAALEVRVESVRYVLEMAPAWEGTRSDRGVVATGPVGSAVLGRSRWFRYELRCWRGGVIPDLDDAVGGPRRIGDDPGPATRILELACEVPRLTWGRDEAGLGEMWNSNSIVAWLLVQSGHDPAQPPPAAGRAPGWEAGVRLAEASGGQPHQARTRRTMRRKGRA